MKSKVFDLLAEWKDVAFTLIVTVLTAFIAFVWLVDYLQSLLMDHVVQVNATALKARKLSDGHYEFSRNWSWLITVTGWMLFSGTVLSFVFWRRANRLPTLLRPYKIAYQSCITSSFRIFNQLYHRGVPPKHHIKSIHTTLKISIDGTTELVENSSISPAGDEPVHFWKRAIDADDESDAVSLLSDIDFRVQDKGDHEVTFLPVADGARRKEPCIFFLPEILPNQTRDLEIYYKWPGLFKRLVEKKEAFYNVTYRSAPGNSGDITLVFEFDARFGPISGENLSPLGTGSSLHDTEGPDGGTVWTLTVTKAPCDGEIYRVKFTTQ